MSHSLPGAELLSAWLESEPGPAGLVNPAGQYTVLNSALRQLVGWTHRDRLPTDRLALLARLPTGWATIPDSPPLDRLAEPSTEPLILSLRDAAGEPWFYESRPLLNPAGRPIGWHDRLARLDADQPAAVQYRLHEALRRKDESLAAISHELRTPLTAIIGFCHLLLRYGEPLSETQQTQVRKIHKNASVQLQLLNNVLDLARLNAGVVTVSHQPFDLAETVRDACEFVEPQSFEKALELRQELPPLPGLIGDRQKVRQVLVNLLGNAVKYTDTGAVTISGAVVEDAVYLQIRDTGRGIPPAQQDRIFEAFMRLPEDEASETGGSGLGLSICARLTRLLGGALTLESTPGEGSTFTLRLPLEPARSPAAAESVHR